MYASEAAVRKLCRSVEVTQDDLDVFEAIAQDEIDSHLAARFNVPFDEPPPAPIATVAAYLAASLILMEKFSVTAEGASENPYARRLWDIGKRKLDDIAQGRVRLPDQSREASLPAGKPADRSQIVTRVRRHLDTGAT